MAAEQVPAAAWTDPSGEPAAAGETASGTEERLLLTAERLFAARGVDAVSIRKITAEAGCNTAAVHYYFSSKEALIEAVLRRRMAVLGARRSAILDELETSGRPVHVRDVVRAFVVPLAEIAFGETGEAPFYVGFLRQVMSHPGRPQALVREEFAPQRQRLHHLLHLAMPDVPRPVLHFRFLIAIDATISHLADLEWSMTPWTDAGARPDRDLFIESLIDAVAGLLSAPVSNADPAGRRRRAGTPRRASRATETLTASTRSTKATGEGSTPTKDQDSQQS